MSLISVILEVEVGEYQSEDSPRQKHETLSEKY
jgi:hypothetical protein